MNLYLQLLTQNQTAAALRLLLVPAQLQAETLGCRLKVAAGGQVQTERFASIESAIDKVAATNFNELEISYSIIKDSKCRLLGDLVSAIGVFTPAPSSDLWFELGRWPAWRDGASKNRRMNAKAAEAALSYNKVSKPSVFEVGIQINSAAQQNLVLDSVAEWLREYTPKAIETLAPFGCVDAGGPDYFVKFESNVLMTRDIRIMAKCWAVFYPELGSRFDALHPLMFGLNGVCEGIARALGDRARLTSCRGLKNMAILRLALGCETPEEMRLVSEYLISSDPASRSDVNVSSRGK